MLYQSPLRAAERPSRETPLWQSERQQRLWEQQQQQQRSPGGAQIYKI